MPFFNKSQLTVHYPSGSIWYAQRHSDDVPEIWRKIVSYWMFNCEEGLEAMGDYIEAEIVDSNSINWWKLIDLIYRLIPQSLISKIKF